MSALPFSRFFSLAHILIGMKSQGLPPQELPLHLQPNIVGTLYGAMIESRQRLGKSIQERVFRDEVRKLNYRIGTSFERRGRFGSQTLHNVEYLDNTTQVLGSGAIDITYNLSDHEVFSQSSN
ncbi:MAG: hypothetical protein AABX66_03900 [Nanoarchaeota archaeon]